MADELVTEFLALGSATQKPGEKPAFDEKNIRRRVYDALNVLMAMDIISTSAACVAPPAAIALFLTTMYLPLLLLSLLLRYYSMLL